MLVYSITLLLYIFVCFFSDTASNEFSRRPSCNVEDTFGYEINFISTYDKHRHVKDNGEIGFIEMTIG